MNQDTPDTPTNPSQDYPGRVCAVCGRALDRHSNSDGEFWAHTGPDMEDEDHPAVPVNPGEVPLRGRCDFCLAEDPAFVLPAASFEVLPGHMSDGNWSACTDCANLIERNQWSGVNRRAQAFWETRNGPMDEHLVTQQKRLYRLLRKNIVGAVRPMQQL